jgi:hypothetical protein
LAPRASSRRTGKGTGVLLWWRGRGRRAIAVLRRGGGRGAWRRLGRAEGSASSFIGAREDAYGVACTRHARQAGVGGHAVEVEPMTLLAIGPDGLRSSNSLRLEWSGRPRGSGLVPKEKEKLYYFLKYFFSAETIPEKSRKCFRGTKIF